MLQNTVFCLPIMSDETLAQPEFAEDVHHNVHGCVIGNCERAEVHDATQLQGRGEVRGLGSSVFSEENP